MLKVELCQAGLPALLASWELSPWKWAAQSPLMSLLLDRAPPRDHAYHLLAQHDFRCRAHLAVAPVVNLCFWHKRRCDRSHSSICLANCSLLQLSQSTQMSAFELCADEEGR